MRIFLPVGQFKDDATQPLSGSFGNVNSTPSATGPFSLGEVVNNWGSGSGNQYYKVNFTNMSLCRTAEVNRGKRKAVKYIIKVL